MTLEILDPLEDRRITPEGARARDWLLAIKSLRATHNISIYEAERILLSDPDWKEWCRRRVALDQKCYKTALAHIRRHGDASLFVLHGRDMSFGGSIG